MPKKSHKNGSGEGNIRKRRPGLWEARYTSGRDSQTGKQIQKSVYGKTREEVSKKLTEIKSCIDKGDYTEPSKLTIGEWVSRWLESYARMSLKASTFENYSILARVHIIPEIGKIPISQIRTADLQDFYNRKFREGKVIVKGGITERSALSVSTVKHIHYIIHAAFKQAKIERLIPVNPDDACVLPRDEKRKVNALPFNILATFLEEAAKGSHYAMLYLDLSTGLRRGELLGLKWADIGFENKCLTVSRQLVRTNKQLNFTTLKTDLSNRTMRIPDSAVEVLLEHRSIQDEMRKSTGAIWNDNDLVFCNELGNPLDPSGVYHYYKRLTKRLGLDESRFHDLRHTFATIALQSGVDIKTIQESLGHYSPAFTLQVYGHVTKHMQDSAAQKVDTFLTGYTKPKGE